MHVSSFSHDIYSDDHCISSEGTIHTLDFRIHSLQSPFTFYGYSEMLVRCTEHQDAFVVYLVGEKDEQGKALFANVDSGVGNFLQNCHSFLPIRRI